MHVRDAGIHKNGMMVFSAHQMGTARMGASPKTSAVDERGECWHVRNLYVSDASVFPTSSGALPIQATRPLRMHVTMTALYSHWKI